MTGPASAWWAGAGRWGAVVALAVVACSGTPPPSAPPERPVVGAGAPADATGAEPTMNKPGLPPLYEVGAPLAPAAALRAWLDDQPPTTTYRLPVELTVSVLGVTGAALGFAADRLPVKVNDSALGESLADRVAGLCGEDAETCALWLHGTWSAGVFRVVRVEGRVADDERATATHALLVR